MGEMYKIVRYVPQNCGPFGGAINGAKWYHGFEAAKKAMHETIVEKFNVMDKVCAESIDAYCKEFYPENVPSAFESLKQLIKDYLTDPATFEKEWDDKYGDIYFEDERVSFGFGLDFDRDGPIRHFYIETAGDFVGKFPTGIISCICLQELSNHESERYISLTADEYCGLEIVFSLMTEEDKNSLPFDDWD